MPAYDYKCLDCEKEFEATNTVAERRNQKCSECGGATKILLGTGIRASIFKPGWWRDIALKPIYIETPQQLRNELDRHNSTAPLLEDGVWRTSPGPDPEHL